LILVGGAWPVIAQTPTTSSMPELYVREKYVELPKKVVIDYDPGSCVSFVKWITGTPQEVLWGNAWDIKPQYYEPKSEGLVLTRDGRGHIAYYKLYGDYLILTEANFIPGQVSTRIISVDSKTIRGYTDPIK